MKLTIPPFVEETAVDNSQMINLSVSSLKPTWSLSVSCSSLVWPCSRTVLPSPFSPKTLWKQGSVFKHASARFNGIPQAQRHEEEKVLQNTIARCWNEHGSLFMCKVLCSVCVCVLVLVILLMWEIACPTSCEIRCPPPRTATHFFVCCHWNLLWCCSVPRSFAREPLFLSGPYGGGGKSGYKELMKA